MKKIYVIIMAIAVTMLVACGEEEVKEIGTTTATVQTEIEDTQQIQIDDQEENEVEVLGYSLEVEGVMVSIDATKEDTIDKISEEPEYFESPSCAYEGTDKIYTYNNYVITFYEDGSSEGISNITMTSDLVSTKEGICIGDTDTLVKEVYGEPTLEEDNLFEYTDEESKIRFIFRDGSVISIEIAKLF